MSFKYMRIFPPPYLSYSSYYVFPVGRCCPRRSLFLSSLYALSCIAVSLTGIFVFRPSALTPFVEPAFSLRFSI